jgi:uncharacterized membrane protein YgcG
VLAVDVLLAGLVTLYGGAKPAVQLVLGSQTVPALVTTPLFRLLLLLASWIVVVAVVPWDAAPAVGADVDAVAWAVQWGSRRGVWFLLAGKDIGDVNGPTSGDGSGSGSGSGSGGGSGSAGDGRGSGSGGGSRSGRSSSKLKPPPITDAYVSTSHSSCPVCVHEDGGPCVSRCAWP